MHSSMNSPLTSIARVLSNRTVTVPVCGQPSPRDSFGVRRPVAPRLCGSGHVLPRFLRSVVLALVLGTSLAGLAAESNATLGDALLLHASFDRGLNADVAAGDAVLYHAPTGNRKDARPGLPGDNLVSLAKGGGRFGDALRFHKKTRPQYFQGEKNLGYRTNQWNGAVSLWLRLDPDTDLEPGYCDPLQFVGQAWEEGNLFIEFSKDHTPRHFRFAIQPVKRFWNPQNRGWEDLPEPERPMVAVHQPPFRRDRWTHVVCCFGNLNSGQKNAWGKLYLDGKLQGEFTGWLGNFNWDVAQSALTLGYSYVGWLDDVAVFNRPLTDSEVRELFARPGGVAGLKSSREASRP